VPQIQTSRLQSESRGVATKVATPCQLPTLRRGSLGGGSTFSENPHHIRGPFTSKASCQSPRFYPSSRRRYVSACGTGAFFPSSQLRNTGLNGQPHGALSVVSRGLEFYAAHPTAKALGFSSSLSMSSFHRLIDIFPKTDLP